jgi:uncharacterized membrane protein YfcA
LLVAELLLLGGVTGFLAELLGVDGGMIMAPFVTFFLSRRGVDPALSVKMAIAKSMGTMWLASGWCLPACSTRWPSTWRGAA